MIDIGLGWALALGVSAGVLFYAGFDDLSDYHVYAEPIIATIILGILVHLAALWQGLPVGQFLLWAWAFLLITAGALILNKKYYVNGQPAFPEGDVIIVLTPIAVLPDVLSIAFFLIFLGLVDVALKVGTAIVKRQGFWKTMLEPFPFGLEVTFAFVMVMTMLGWGRG